MEWVAENRMEGGALVSCVRKSMRRGRRGRKDKVWWNVVLAGRVAICIGDGVAND